MWLRDVILCHASNVSQSYFTGNEYSLAGANSQNSKILLNTQHWNVMNKSMILNANSDEIS